MISEIRLVLQNLLAAEISEILKVLQHGGFLLENQLDGLVGVVRGVGGHEESFEEVVGTEPDVGDQAGGT